METDPNGTYCCLAMQAWGKPPWSGGRAWTGPEAASHSLTLSSYWMAKHSPWQSLLTAFRPSYSTSPPSPLPASTQRRCTLKSSLPPGVRWSSLMGLTSCGTMNVYSRLKKKTLQRCCRKTVDPGPTQLDSYTLPSFRGFSCRAALFCSRPDREAPRANCCGEWTAFWKCVASPLNVLRAIFASTLLILPSGQLLWTA